MSFLLQRAFRLPRRVKSLLLLSADVILLSTSLLLALVLKQDSFSPLVSNQPLNVEGPGPEPENLQHPFEFHGRVPADGWVQRRGNAIGNGKRRDAGRVEMGICPLPETQLTLHHEGIAVDLEANPGDQIGRASC